MSIETHSQPTGNSSCKNTTNHVGLHKRFNHLKVESCLDLILPTPISEALLSRSLLSLFKCNHSTNPATFRLVSPQLLGTAMCKTIVLSQLQRQITDTVFKEPSISLILIPTKLKDKQTFCIVILCAAVNSKAAAETYSN